MGILSQAFVATRRNWPAVLLFLAIAVPVSTLFLAGSHFMSSHYDVETQPGPFKAFSFLRDLVLYACVALGQALAFSRIGREMDQPLWKIEGDAEALKRFFPLWFILNLVSILPIRMAFAIPDAQNSPFAVFLLLMTFALLMFCVPVGACVMFQGHFRWRHVGESLRPLGKQIPLTATVLLFNFTQIFFMQVLVEVFASAKWIYPFLDIASCYCDCLVFAAIWIICIIDRNTPDEPDFDL